MRYNYPISSQEFLDTVDQIYEMQLYVLGYASGVIIQSGIYDGIDASGEAIFSSGYSSFRDILPNIGKINYIEDQMMKG